MRKKAKEIDDVAQKLVETTRGMLPAHRVFLAHYLRTFNAAESARLAGYAGAGGARATGNILLRSPRIKAAIEEHLKDIYMPIVEMKARISEHARGSMESFLDVDDDSGDVAFNFKKAKDHGALMLLKKFETKESFIPQGKGEMPIRVVQTKIELYDAQDALVQIGKLEGLFKEHVVVDSSGENGPLAAMMAAFEAGKTQDDKKTKMLNGGSINVRNRK